MLVNSIFSFSYYVFKNLIFQGSMNENQMAFGSMRMFFQYFCKIFDPRSEGPPLK